MAELGSLREAVSELVHDGDEVALEGFTHLIPRAAAAMNRSDVLNARGAVSLTALPRVPGRDFAGVVVEGPEELVGTEVFGTGGGDLGVTRDISHAAYVVLPRSAVVPTPDNLPLKEAAASGLAHVTAATALLDLGGLSSGETVLVTGAAGGVGSAAARIAQWKGARMIGAVKDDSERQTTARAGVEALIDTSREKVSAAASAATEGRGVDLVLGCKHHSGDFVWLIPSAIAIDHHASNAMARVGHSMRSR